MNAIRKWAYAVAALILATVAVPAIAATKQFNIAATSTGGQTTLTVSNGSQGGNPANSTINSIWFKAPFDVSNVQLQASLVTSNTKYYCDGVLLSGVCTAGKKVSITWINNIAVGASGTVTMTGAPASDPSSCSTQFQWQAQAFTGNALGGTNFTTSPSVGNDGITASATESVTCTLEFVKQPANSEADTNITSVVGNPTGAAVQVRALIGGAVATGFTGPITLTETSGTLAGGGPVNAVAGVATFGNPPTATALTLHNPGTYQLTAAATGSNFSSVVSNAFKIFGGVLDCNPQPPFEFGDLDPSHANQPGYAYGSRGRYNKDGIPCVPVLYTFETTHILDPVPYVQLTWDLSGDQKGAAYQYTVNWAAQDVDYSTTSKGFPVTQRPVLTWQFDANNQPVNKRLGIACLDRSLPAPYGRLASFSGTADSGTITIDKSVPAGTVATPTAYSFPIMIGNERLQATYVSTSGNIVTLTVVRHQGGTTGNANLSSMAGTALVMSTPLPIDVNALLADGSSPNPGVNKVAQMCLIEHGWMSYTPNPVTGVARAFYFTTIFDIGDGWVSPK